MDAQKMMGFSVPGDQRVPIPARSWNAMKLALWRSKKAWEIAAQAASEIVAQCAHHDECPAKNDETAPCIAHRYNEEGAQIEVGCRDRELRMSALVILNAARMFAPIDAQRLANEPYMAPSREFFSEVTAELAAARAELEMLYKVLQDAGIPAPTPPSNAEAALPPKTPG